MQPEITAFHHPATGRVTYLIADPATLLCAFVDPVLDYDPLTQAVDTRFVDAIIADVRARDLGPTWILETGLHTDHLSAAGHLKYETGASICIGAPVLDSLRRLVERELAAEQPVDRHPVGVEQPAAVSITRRRFQRGALRCGAPQAPIEAINDSRLWWNSSPRRTLAAPPW
mgnify:CR=1 FL=1